jgi:hypothetical protein
VASAQEFEREGLDADELKDLVLREVRTPSKLVVYP